LIIECKAFFKHEMKLKKKRSQKKSRVVAANEARLRGAKKDLSRVVAHFS